MNYGDASDFTPIDLAGSLAVNMGVSHLAAKDASFRVGIMKDKNGDVPAWADARLIGGAVAAVVSQFFAGDNPMVRRMGHDAAIGLLGSYVSTETCRAAAESKMQSTEPGAAVAGMSGDDYLLGADLLDDEDMLGLDEVEMAELDEMNFAYGW
jgi:hypothetical protein